MIEWLTIKPSKKKEKPNNISRCFEIIRWSF